MAHPRRPVVPLGERSLALRPSRSGLRAARTTALAAAVASGACGSASRPPPTGDSSDGGIATRDSSADSPGSSSSDSSASDVATDAPAESASAGESGLSDAGADGPAVVQPACIEGAWTTTTPVTSIPTAGFHRFGAVAASETVVAWTAAGGAIFVADRPSTSAPFGSPVAVDTSSTPVADDRVALMPNGLEVIATRADRMSPTSFVRAAVGSPWSASTDAGEFKFIAAALTEAGGAFSEPVVSADGFSLFYLLATGTAPPVFTESSWNPGTKAWDAGAALPNQELAVTTAAQVRRPTGASSDRRTLFFFDEANRTERVAWRNSPTSPFDFFDDLSLAPEAAPSGTCSRLYFQSGDPDAGTGGVSIAQ
jgi:hypothetical protein